MKFICCLFLLCCFVQPAYALLLEDAQQDYLYGNYQSAITKANKLKENSDVLYFLGLVHMKMGDYYKARSYFNRLLERFPGSAESGEAYLKLADSYFLAKELDKAKDLYEDVIERTLDPDRLPLAYLRLAQIASKEGNWDKKKEYVNILRNKHSNSEEIKFLDILESYGDFFTIQVGAFGTKRNALVLQEELKKKGYKAYTVTDETSELPLYKVRVGKFKQQWEVKKFAKELLGKGYPARIYP